MISRVNPSYLLFTDEVKITDTNDCEKNFNHVEDSIS